MPMKFSYHHSNTDKLLLICTCSQDEVLANVKGANFSGGKEMIDKVSDVSLIWILNRDTHTHGA